MLTHRFALSHRSNKVQLGFLLLRADNIARQTPLDLIPESILYVEAMYELNVEIIYTFGSQYC